MSSSVHPDNKKKDILILGKGPTQGLDDTTLTAEAEYSINFPRSNRKFSLSLHYNGSNSFLFVTATKIYQFKAKDSEIMKYPLYIGNISKDFTANIVKKRALLKQPTTHSPTTDPLTTLHLPTDPPTGRHQPMLK